MKCIFAAGLLCTLALFGQQQPPAPAPDAPPPAPAQPPQQPAPLPPPVDETRNDIDRGGFIKLFYWQTVGKPDLLPGKKAANRDAQTLHDFAHDDKSTPGGVIAFPAGKFNRLEISYFQARGAGNTIAANDLSFFGTNFSQGDFIATTFRVRSAKVSWNYLTWPDPPEESKFRIKTLWEFQYTSIESVLDEPFNFDPTFSPAINTKSIFYPTFGLGAEYTPSKHFYFDLRVSGFGLPHRSVIGDAEGSLVIRIKRLEILPGYKWYHFKTSPQSDQYVAGTLKGPYGAIRLVFH